MTFWPWSLVDHNVIVRAGPVFRSLCQREDLVNVICFENRVSVEALMECQGIEREVSEQWTTSRAAVVLGGPVAILIDVAQRLNVPTETVIETRRGEAVLGLWGELLAAYQDLKRSEHMLSNHSPSGPSPAN